MHQKRQAAGSLKHRHICSNTLTREMKLRTALGPTHPSPRGDESRTAAPSAGEAAGSFSHWRGNAAGSKPSGGGTGQNDRCHCLSTKCLPSHSESPPCRCTSNSGRIICTQQHCSTVISRHGRPPRRPQLVAWVNTLDYSHAMKSQVLL